MFPTSVVDAILPIAADMSSLSLIHYFSQEPQIAKDNTTAYLSPKDEILTVGTTTTPSTNTSITATTTTTTTTTATTTTTTTTTATTATTKTAHPTIGTATSQLKFEEGLNVIDWDSTKFTNPSPQHQDTGILTFGVVSGVPGLQILSKKTGKWDCVEELYPINTVVLWLGEKVTLFSGT